MHLVKEIDHGHGITERYFSDGRHEWRKNDIVHRDDDLPSVDKKDNSKYWYKNGLCHRENGPAVEYPDGSKMWMQNGKEHREDGPAVIYTNGYKQWYLNGIEYTEQEFNEILLKRELQDKLNNELSINEVQPKRLKL